MERQEILKTLTSTPKEHVKTYLDRLHEGELEGIAELASTIHDPNKPLAKLQVLNTSSSTPRVT